MMFDRVVLSFWYRVMVSHSVGPQIQPPTSGYIIMKLCHIKGPFTLSESKRESGVASRLILQGINSYSM